MGGRKFHSELGDPPVGSAERRGGVRMRNVCRVGGDSERLERVNPSAERC